jgi:hypothetical protein
MATLILISAFYPSRDYRIDYIIVGICYIVAIIITNLWRMRYDELKEKYNHLLEKIIIMAGKEK